MMTSSMQEVTPNSRSVFLFISQKAECSVIIVRATTVAGVKEALLQDAGTIVSLNNIPETSEDISPYATFQLSGPGADPHSTLLHSFMYHEQALTEGCASPPPPAGVNIILLLCCAQYLVLGTVLLTCLLYCAVRSIWY
jgi:hypothetical protein